MKETGWENRVFHKELSCLRKAQLIGFQQMASRHYRHSLIATSHYSLSQPLFAIKSLHSPVLANTNHHYLLGVLDRQHRLSLAGWSLDLQNAFSPWQSESRANEQDARNSLLWISIPESTGSAAQSVKPHMNDQQPHKQPNNQKK